jgi:hypothetical protein
MNEKKWLRWIIIALFVLVGVIYILNIKVTTKQGINFQVQTIKIPLYLKALDFFDRHYNYKWTVERIIGDSKTEREKVFKIFEWTYKTIKKNPEGYPIIDDHVWHIIVRGYGAGDQFSDVFTALCNYAGIDAFFDSPYSEDRTSRIILSLVKIGEVWTIFDPYRGVYFKNREGSLASIEDIMKGDWVKEDISKDNDMINVDYTIYFKNLSPIRKMGLKRANTQSPLNRLKYEIKNWLN